MKRALEIIDNEIASLDARAEDYEAQTMVQAPLLAAVHHFAAATLRDVRRQIATSQLESQ